MDNQPNNKMCTPSDEIINGLKRALEFSHINHLTITEGSVVVRKEMVYRSQDVCTFDGWAVDSAKAMAFDFMKELPGVTELRVVRKPICKDSNPDNCIVYLEARVDITNQD